MTINEAYELVLLKWTLLKEEFDKKDKRDLNLIYWRIKNRPEFKNHMFGCAYCDLFNSGDLDNNCVGCPLNVKQPCYELLHGTFTDAIDDNDRPAARKAINELLKLIVKTKPDDTVCNQNDN
jgi:hypothetical protein